MLITVIYSSWKFFSISNMKHKLELPFFVWVKQDFVSGKYSKPPSDVKYKHTATKAAKYILSSLIEVEAFSRSQVYRSKMKWTCLKLFPVVVLNSETRNLSLLTRLWMHQMNRAPLTRHWAPTRKGRDGFHLSYVCVADVTTTFSSRVTPLLL